MPLIAMGVSIVLWSTAYVGSGIVLETSSPAVLSVGRFLVALVVLIPFALRRPGFAAALRNPRTVLLGLVGVSLYYSFANISLLFTTPGTVALTAALSPVLTTLVALFLLRERLQTRTIIGLVLATVGVILVSASQLHLDVGVLLNVVALLAYAVYTVLLRRDSQRGRAVSSDPVVLATATAMWGTVLMLPWLAIEIVTGGSRMPEGLGGIGGILYLGLVVSAPTLVLFNYGAERLPAAVTGIAIAGIPALGYALAVALGEPLDPVKTIGGAVSLVGILIATLTAPQPEPVAPALVPESIGTDAHAPSAESPPPHPPQQAR
ncbi:DMT family transporter [soil metagenome]